MWARCSAGVEGSCRAPSATPSLPRAGTQPDSKVRECVLRLCERRGRRMVRVYWLCAALGGVLRPWRIRLWTAGPLEGSTPPSPFPQGASLSSAPAPPWCSSGLWLSRPLRKEIPRPLPASPSLRPHLVEGRAGLTSDSGSCRDPRLLPSVPRGVRNKGRPRGWRRNLVASSAGTNRCVSV